MTPSRQQIARIIAPKHFAPPGGIRYVRRESIRETALEKADEILELFASSQARVPEGAARVEGWAARLEKRCVEIEAQTAKYPDWWRDGTQHAADLRALLAAVSGPARVPDGLRQTLIDHYLWQIHCDEETKTDRAQCSCGLWTSDPQPSVGEAAARWAEHVLGFISQRPVAQSVEPSAHNGPDASSSLAGPTSLPEGWALVKSPPDWNMVTAAGQVLWETATQANHELAERAVKSAIAASPQPPEREGGRSGGR